MAATVRADVIIPEVFTPYIEEATTFRNAFVTSGVVAPMEELNASNGGDFVVVPNWTANLSGEAEILTDSSSLTPSNISADKQRAAILHRGKAWGARDLARLAAGSDPLAAIGNKVAAFIARQQQKDLLAALNGVFGAAFSSLVVPVADPYPTPALVAAARSTMGEQGEKLSVMAIHSTAYYGLVQRQAIDYVRASEIPSGTAALGGSFQGAFGDVRVPTFMNMSVVVTDDIGVNDVFMFAGGSIASGQQAGLNTETDRDILAKASYLSVDWHNVYHPIGSRYVGTTPNPDRTELATAANWELVFDLKNIGIVKGVLND